MGPKHLVYTCVGPLGDILSSSCSGWVGIRAWVLGSNMCAVAGLLVVGVPFSSPGFEWDNSWDVDLSPVLQKGFGS